MFAILVVAAVLRFTGLGWGLAGRTSFHPDEDKILWQLERMRLGALDLDPKDFGWGTLQTYLVGGTLFALDRIGAFGEGWRSAFREGREAHAARLFVAGRALSALFGVVTAAVVAAIAWRTAGPRAGLLAACLLAVSPLHMLHSHYLTVDVALGFWLALALWMLPRSAAWAGFLIGLAIATKPGTLVVAPVLLLFDRRPRTLAALAGGFLAGEPYALLAFREWSSATLAIAARSFSAAPEAFPIPELLARHGLQLLLYGLGPAATAAALVGLGRADRVLAWAAAALALTLLLSRFPMGRYVVPLLPLLAVAGGLALARLPRRMLAIALPLALVPPFLYSAAQVAALHGAHPFQQASSWIEARRPAGASVARLWAEYPPLDETRYRPVMLEDPFALQGRAYQPLTADIVVLDDLPLHPWRPELLADLAANYAVAARFRRPLSLFSLVLPEPWAPHDSGYARPEVTLYERLARSGVQRHEGVPAAPARGRAGGDRDAGVVEVAQDVGAVPGRAHPLLDHLASAALARGQVLGGRSVAVAPAADRGEGRRSVGRCVVEVALLEHVVDPVLRGRVEPAVEAERRQPMPLPVIVHGLEHVLGEEATPRAPLGEPVGEPCGDGAHACLLETTAFRERGHGRQERRQQRQRGKSLKTKRHAAHGPDPSGSGPSLIQQPPRQAGAG